MNSEKKKNESFVFSNHANIFYESYGSGTPMIMLHGNMQNNSYFSKQVAFFKTRFNVITIDSRGHGKSDFGLSKLTLNLLAEDVINVINALKLDHLILLGFSDGGNIALRLAQLIPEKMIAIIAVGANSSPNGLKNLVKIPSGVLYRLLKKMATFKMFSSVKWLNERAEVIALMIHEPDLIEDQMHRIRLPILIITGQYDLVHLHHSQMMCEALPLAKLEIIKNSGHNLLRTHAKLANNIIMAFLDQIEIKNN